MNYITLERNNKMSIFDIFNQISKEKESPVGAKPEYLIVGLCKVV